MVQNPNPSPSDEDSKIVMKYYFFILDDKVHDSNFVQYCLILHWNDLMAIGIRPKRHFVWSNGCKSQFKNKISWYFVSCYPKFSDDCICL